MRIQCSLCLAFLATAAIFLSGQAKAGKDLCEAADYKALCKKVVKGTTDPGRGTETIIKELISQTKKAETKYSGQAKKDSRVEGCLESYKLAIEALEDSLKALNGHDKSTLDANLSGALTSYGDCDDQFTDFGKKPPVRRTNKHLLRLCSNCLAMAKLVHWK